MIKEVVMFTVICDNCGVDANEDAEYCAYNTEGFAVDNAIDSDWIEHEGNHYCPDCFEYGDNDELTIKQRK